MNKMYLSLLMALMIVAGCVSDYGDGNVSKGSDYYLNGEYENAEMELRNALNKELAIYTKKELFTILGNVYNEMNEFDSSIVYHKKALAIDSNYVDALVNLGIVYRLTAEFDLAEKYYMKAMMVNPNDPELHASLGALNIYRGEIDKAIESLERSIELNPQLAVTHSNYALALAMNGNFEKAEKELTKAVALGYKNGDIIKERIEELKKLGG